jgi:hypothetical protein
MPSPSTSRRALVVQASFAPGKDPRAPKPAPRAEASAEKPAQSRNGKPPHPATVTQKKAAPAKQARPPHPATAVAQKKEAPAARKERSPHPATLPRGRKAAQAAIAANTFEAPAGLLKMGTFEHGKPLPDAIQRAMADRFEGADFASVRVHEGPEAAALGALAFTAGDHLYFAPGQYRPETKSGRALITKQLAYVLQQREGRVTNPFGTGVAVVQDPALEAEAMARAGIARR